jgi:hypothetical protein
MAYLGRFQPIEVHDDTHGFEPETLLLDRHTLPPDEIIHLLPETGTAITRKRDGEYEAGMWPSSDTRGEHFFGVLVQHDGKVWRRLQTKAFAADANPKFSQMIVNAWSIHDEHAGK